MHYLKDLLQGPWAPLGLFLWSLVESAGIPNPSGTDVVLLLLCATRPAEAPLFAVLASIGSLIGSMIFFEITRKGGEKLLVRYSTSSRGARFRRWFQRYGLVTVFISAVIPIPTPFKVLAACAGATGVPRWRFFLVMLASRIPRYGGLAYLGAKLGEGSSAWLVSHRWNIVGVAVVLFVMLYGLVRWSDRTRGAAEAASAGSR